MNRVIPIVFGSLLLLSGCSKTKGPSMEPKQQATTSEQPSPATQQSNQATQPVADNVASKAAPGSLTAGQASGSYTAKGETVELKYAYAGRGIRFGSESTIILLTDKPIPPDAVAEEINSQKMLLDGKLRGLEYAIEKDGYWVRYHPGQYQESKGGQLKEFSIDGGVVRGADEDTGDLTNGRYSRSVKFIATIIK